MCIRDSNVDLVASVLTELLPPANRDEEEEEEYSGLLEDLVAFKVLTAEDLRKLIETNLKRVLDADAHQVKEEKASEQSAYPLRVRRGVYFTHVGLARLALKLQFGEAYKKYHATRD